MPSSPFICFLCPTYGRVRRQPELIAEAVYWFTKQEYENCELLILNDCKEQEITCNVPGVTMVNCEYRYPTLGQKMNAMVELAPEGSVCAVYEDDDIILPWRCEEIVKGIRGVDFWSPGKWWYCEKGIAPQIDTNGYGYTSCAFRREAGLGGHEKVSEAHDRKFVVWASENLKCRFANGNVPADRISYCYRWGVSQIHLSGTGFIEEAYKDFYPGRGGKFTIVPKMEEDWVQSTRNAIKTLKK